MKSARRRIDVNLEELDRVLDGARQEAAERKPITTSSRAYCMPWRRCWCDRAQYGEDQHCGGNTGEIRQRSTGNQPDTDSPPSPGHGRNRAGAFGGARWKVDIPHQDLKHGDRCPECESKGNVYGQKEPKVLVRIVGQAPLAATVYSLERLRCGASVDRSSPHKSRKEWARKSMTRRQWQ